MHIYFVIPFTLPIVVLASQQLHAKAQLVTGHRASQLRALHLQNAMFPVSHCAFQSYVIKAIKPGHAVSAYLRHLPAPVEARPTGCA